MSDPQEQRLFQVEQALIELSHGMMELQQTVQAIYDQIAPETDADPTADALEEVKTALKQIEANTRVMRDKLK